MTTTFVPLSITSSALILDRPKLLADHLRNEDEIVRFRPFSDGHSHKGSYKYASLQQFSIYALLIESVLLVWLRSLLRGGQWEKLMRFSPWNAESMFTIKRNRQLALSEWPRIASLDTEKLEAEQEKRADAEAARAERRAAKKAKKDALEAKKAAAKTQRRAAKPQRRAAKQEKRYAMEAGKAERRAAKKPNRDAAETAKAEKASAKVERKQVLLYKRQAKLAFDQVIRELELLEKTNASTGRNETLDEAVAMKARQRASAAVARSKIKTPEETKARRAKTREYQELNRLEAMKATTTSASV